MAITSRPASSLDNLVGIWGVVTMETGWVVWYSTYSPHQTTASGRLFIEFELLREDIRWLVTWDVMESEYFTMYIAECLRARNQSLLSCLHLSIAGIYCSAPVHPSQLYVRVKILWLYRKLCLLLLADQSACPYDLDDELVRWPHLPPWQPQLGWQRSAWRTVVYKQCSCPLFITVQWWWDLFVMTTWQALPTQTVKITLSRFKPVNYRLAVLLPWYQ